jgi:RNA polymerase sigma-70 factor (ECF subfamily)
MNEQSDNELVRQCLQGLTKAFEELVLRYEKPIYNTVYRMTRSRAEAEDITQSAFIKAYEKLDTYKPKFRFFSWIYRIAVNEALNAIQIRDRFCSLDQTADEKVKTPEDIYEESELYESIHEALMEMPLDYHAVIVLKHLQNFSYRDIAYILDIPEKKVKSRLFSARQQMKEILLKRGIISHEK